MLRCLYKNMATCSLHTLFWYKLVTLERIKCVYMCNEYVIFLYGLPD